LNFQLRISHPESSVYKAYAKRIIIQSKLEEKVPKALETLEEGNKLTYYIDKENALSEVSIFFF